MSRDFTDEATELQYEEYRRTLSQVLNRHGAVVLEGRCIGKVSIEVSSFLFWKILLEGVFSKYICNNQQLA